MLTAEGDPNLASAAAEVTVAVPQTDAETAPEAAAEAEAEEDPIPEAPTIPVEVPVQVELIRQTDRPPVVAPSDAIGELAACTATCVDCRAKPGSGSAHNNGVMACRVVCSDLFSIA